ncbi:hypothetical protein GCE86_11825 [Micromonospora terminaliae]|uniref:Uncharacterized protein n=1 Tax=Micromonospora terminaliae TaxID=1914461 RepID=A0ABX6E1X2_9ACTN|nr:hypothetical protein GCE86_11825 [Micromonospora terminaliae]
MTGPGSGSEAPAGGGWGPTRRRHLRGRSSGDDRVAKRPVPLPGELRASGAPDQPATGTGDGRPAPRTAGPMPAAAAA